MERILGRPKYNARDYGCCPKKSRIGSQCLGVVIGLSHASLEESFARYTTRSGVNHVAGEQVDWSFCVRGLVCFDLE